MQEIKAKALELVQNYEDQLTECGIKLLISKRYIETKVHERSGGSGMSAIFNSLDRHNDKKAEIKYGYNYQNNKYHCIVMTVAPLNKKLVKLENCVEYAFVLEKTTRAHIGLEPFERAYEETKILDKIERRILKILRKAKAQDPEQVCTNTFFDALRYSHSPKYEYKTKYCGKDRDAWDMICMWLSLAVFAVVFAAAFLVTKLIRG